MVDYRQIKGCKHEHPIHVSLETGKLVLLCKDCATLLEDVHLTLKNRCKFLAINKKAYCPFCLELKDMIGIYPYSKDGRFIDTLSFLACDDCAEKMQLYRAPEYKDEEERKHYTETQ